MSYKGQKKDRSVNFTVIARSREDAQSFVTEATARGKDSAGADLEWTQNIPWEEVTVATPEEMGEELEAPQKLEGWVELR